MLTRIVLVSGKSNLSSAYLKNFIVKEIVFPSKLKGPSLSRISAVGVGCIVRTSPDIRFAFFITYFLFTYLQDKNGFKNMKGLKTDSDSFIYRHFLVRFNKTPQPASVILKPTAPFLALTA